MRNRLVLASESPRRKEILKSRGLEFTAVKSGYTEPDSGDPVTTAVNNALGKARDVFVKEGSPSGVTVLGADTVVFYGGEILGKPENAQAAVKTLKKLSGKTHKVVTGYAIVGKNSVKTGYDVSEVTFNELSDALIKEYVGSGLPLDKAGSYGLQDGFPIVKSFSGDRENVIGLPFDKIVKETGGF